MFVQEGGQVTIGAGTEAGGSVTAGAAGSAGDATAGSAFGSGIFLQGDQTLMLAPGADQVLTIADVIADQTGSGGTGANAGAGGLRVGQANVAGTVTLSATSSFTGGIALKGGTLVLAAAGAAGAGAITFGAAAGQTLQIDAAALTAGAVANRIDGLAIGDVIDLQGAGLETLAALGRGNTLTLSGGAGSVTLHFDPAQSFAGLGLRLTRDDAGGTAVTLDGPVLTASGGGIFTGGGPAVTADPGITIADLGDEPLTSATVSITGGFRAGDRLSFLNTGASLFGDIGSTYASATGVLSLTSAGAATLAQWQAALQAVSYGFSPGDGDPTGGGADPGRTVSYAVSDAVAAGTVATDAITVIHAPPAVGAGGSADYTVGGAATAIDPGLTVTAPDSGGLLTGAAVSVTGNLHGGDILGFVAQSGITGVYDTGTGTLNLSGSATAAQYQAALESVTFSVTSPASPGTRTISYAVNDGTAQSGAAASTVNVFAPPSFIADTATPGTGDFDAGHVITFTLTPSAAVSVTGAPVLMLNDGGMATYDAAVSSSTSLVFTTTVAAGQNAASLAVTGLELAPGASIRDGTGADAVLDGADATFFGLDVDTAAPAITAFGIDPSAGILGVGGAGTFAMTLSEDVTVSGGTPILVLSDGGIAAYDAAASTAGILVFDYIVAAGQNGSDVTVANVDLQAAGITDAAGNDADLGAALGQPGNTLQIATAPPVVSSPTLREAENAGAAAMGIAAPSDPNFTAAQLTITVDTLPADGAVTLADGTAVTVGEGLTEAQLTGLLFTPDAGSFDATSGFTYAVADPAGNSSVGTVTLSIGPAIGNPVPAPGALLVGFAQGATALGIQAPTDPNFPAADLSITVDSLPTDGTLTQPDGMTPITIGDVLSVAQLTALQFIAAAGASGVASSFGYTVSDIAGHRSSGAFGLDVGAQPVPAAPSITTPNEITDTATPTITGVAEPGVQVSLYDGASLVGAATADVSGKFAATLSGGLTLGSNSLTAIATNAAGASAASAAAGIFDLGSPDANGVIGTDVTSAQLGALLGQGYALAFIPGAAAIALVDGTLSVGADTNEAMIQRLYEGLLGRSGDPAGLSFWDAQIAAGASLAAVAAGFLASPEYQASEGALSNVQFEESLYQASLGRAPEAAGGAFWTAVLDSGASRADVAIGITQSAEAQADLAPKTSQVWDRSATGTLAEEIYQTGLDRVADQAAVAFVRSVVAQGATALQVARGVVASAEFQALHGAQSDTAFIASLYQDGLGRPPDAAGARFYAGLLNSGAGSRADVLADIATSFEASVHLTANLT